MEKRKSTESSGQNDGRRKKRRKSHHGRKKSQLVVKPDHATQIREQIRAMKAPPGLSKRQRKRWRRKQLKDIYSNEARLAIPSRPEGNVQTRTATATAPATFSAQSNPSSLNINALLKRYSVTKLMQRPEKRWDDYRERPGIAAEHAVSADSNTLQTTMKPAVSSKRLSSSLEQRQRDPSHSRSSQTSWQGDTSDSGADDAEVKAVRNVRDAIAKNHHTIVRESSKDDRDAEALPGSNISQMAPPRTTDASPWRLTASKTSSLNALLSTPFLEGSRIRRPSFGQKPNSIPSHAEDMDAAGSFRRFSAYLRGRDVDSDEDESDESDEESSSVLSDTENGAVPPSLGNISLRVPAVEDNDQLRISPSSARSIESGLIDAGLPLSKEISTRQEPEKLSAISENTHINTPSNTTSWAANVGMKRQMTTPGSEQPTKPAALPSLLSDLNGIDQTPAFRSRSLSPSERSDDESSEALFQTIDEVSQNVFSLTHPLPACKPPVSPDPIGREDQENGLMTSASSNLRVTRSMTTPTKATMLNMDKTIRPEEKSVVICNTVQIPDLDLTPIRSYPEEKEQLVSGKHGETDSPLPAGQGKKKRKMTGMSSKHFTPEKPIARNLRSTTTPQIYNDDSKVANDSSKDSVALGVEDDAVMPENETEGRSTRSSTRKQRKGTRRKSEYFTPTKPALDPDVIDRVDFYNTTAGVKNKSLRGRIPGVSTAPVPPITSDRFGIIQEKLWREPFWLLIAVTFLNKTTGRAAAPVFWELKKRYITPEALGQAPQEDLEGLIWHLGLQRQRSNRLIQIAKAWVNAPPKPGIRWRCLHYPSKGDGKDYKATVAIEGDAEDCAGALEIGNIPGCGPYAWDSWRIFCRDVLRDVAHDYNGSEGEPEGFVPEWMKVLPGDKELRACLRWMWLREGWIWDCETGEKRRATEVEMEMAVKGEMEIEDEQERKFAARAAGLETSMTPGKDGDLDVQEDRSLPQAEDENEVIVSSRTKRVRRSARLST